jgi:hypothetical protein
MIKKEKIYYKQAVELILLYESSREYADDYIINLCKLAMKNAEKIADKIKEEENHEFNIEQE